MVSQLAGASVDPLADLMEGLSTQPAVGDAFAAIDWWKETSGGASGIDLIGMGGAPPVPTRAGGPLRRRPRTLSGT